MKITKKTLLFLIFSFFTLIKAEEVIQNSKNNQLSYPKLKVFIKATEWQYALNKPALFKITIINESSNDNVFRLHLYENPFHHFKIKVFDQYENRLPETLNYSTWKGTLIEKNEKPRRIHLKQGERFTTLIDLSKWVDFNKSGKFFVEGTFFPNPFFEENAYSYKISHLSFNVSKEESQIIYKKKPSKEIVQIQKKFESSQSSPKNTVIKHLTSHIEEKWNHFFKTVDTKQYLENSYASTEIYERFKTSKHDERIIILKEFEAFLIKNSDYKIDSFEILETYIKKDEKAEVKVYIKTKNKNEKYSKKFNPLTGQIEDIWKSSDVYTFLQDKIFQYYLEKTQEEWKIIQKKIKILKKDITKAKETKTVTTFTEQKSQIPPTFIPIIENVIFKRGQSEFITNSYPTLKKASKLLKQFPYLFITIRGHTDTEGNSELNYQLSLQRVLAVKNHLIKNGLSKKRIQLEAYGEKKPIYQEEDENLKEKNRRVEIIFSHN